MYQNLFECLDKPCPLFLMLCHAFWAVDRLLLKIVFFFNKKNSAKKVFFFLFKENKFLFMWF